MYCGPVPVPCPRMRRGQAQGRAPAGELLEPLVDVLIAGRLAGMHAQAVLAPAGSRATETRPDRGHQRGPESPSQRPEDGLSRDRCRLDDLADGPLREGTDRPAEDQTVHRVERVPVGEARQPLRLEER